MIIKQTYADSGVWTPTSGEPAKKVAGPCEVSALKLSSGTGAAYVSIYDGKDASDAIPANLRWVLDTSTTDNDTNHFTNPIRFSKGVYAVCEQGINLAPVLCIARTNI